MNPNCKLLITAVAAAAGLALLTTAVPSLYPDIPDTVRNWRAAIAEKLTLPLPAGCGSTGNSVPAGVSMELDDAGSHYTVTLRLPDKSADRVSVKLTDRTLRIEAPSDRGTFRQTLVLADADHSAVPAIERGTDAGRVTVTVPKNTGGSGLSVSWPDVRSLFSRFWNAPDPFQSFPALSRPPGWSVWKPFEDFGDSGVREKNGSYTIELHFPGCTLDHVNAEVHDGLLTVEALGSKEEARGRERVSRKVRFSRTATLPGPVDSAGLKLETKGDRLTVTVPKAAAAAG